jgi:hypothetical protein
MQHFAMLTGILLLAACQTAPQGDRPPPERAGAASPEAGAELRTDRTRYAPGDEVRLELHSRTADDIGYNLCVSTLETRADGDWAPSPEQVDEVCPMILRLLEPGASASYELRLPAVQPGEYRFRTTIEHMPTGERRDVATPPFRVER